MTTSKKRGPSIVVPEIHSRLIKPNSFEPNNHWVHKGYEKPIDSVVKYFLGLDTSCIVRRYCMLHPTTNKEVLEKWLTYQSRYFTWAGSDVMKVTTEDGHKKMVIIENNSCPEGQKYMPLLDQEQKQGGYHTLIQRTFKTVLDKREPIEGELAVIYDKNPIETTGYAHTMADIFDEEVHFVPACDNTSSPFFEFRDGVLYVIGEDREWHPIRAAFRYVTQRPWNRLPISTKTLIVNPPIACLAGGRNKLLAAKAYSRFNQELEGSGLAINTPFTICDVRKSDIANIVKEMGGQAVIKVPYSNAGQGVYIVKNEQELQDFLKQDHPYDLFIVQQFIGAYTCQNNNHNAKGKLYHVGTIPSDLGIVYVYDIRVMLSSTPTGLKPIGMYSRRASRPIVDVFGERTNQTDAYMTNLSFKNPDGSWNSDTARLIRYDCSEFYKVGLGLDDLIEAYVQAVLSTIAVDKMAHTLCDEKGQFKHETFHSLNNDPVLLSEIMF